MMFAFAIRPLIGQMKPCLGGKTGQQHRIGPLYSRNGVL